jgi:hypothetical protein
VYTDIINQSGWGEGRPAFLWIKVTDTGCGMAEHEQKNLFSRFQQATPRTHVKYGGSGLGLFISKSLATLQGGAIGVFSNDGIGSTFAFFVSTRVAEPPPDHTSGPVLQKRLFANQTMSHENAMKAVELNVLLVEDNLVNQKVLKSSCRGADGPSASQGMGKKRWSG